MQPVCLVIGAGAGIGSHVGSRFAREGLPRRCSAGGPDEEGAEPLGRHALPRDGGAGIRLLCSTPWRPDTIEERIAAVESRPSARSRWRSTTWGRRSATGRWRKTSHNVFELGWRLGTFGLFRLASAVPCPLMEQRGSGNHPRHPRRPQRCAATRGQHSHASRHGAGGACSAQSLNAEFGPKGIHVAHIIVDGMVRCARYPWAGCWARRRSRSFEKSADWSTTACCSPPRSPTTYFQLAQQHRSAWTHEIDLRPFSGHALVEPLTWPAGAPSGDTFLYNSLPHRCRLLVDRKLRSPDDRVGDSPNILDG